MIKTIEMGGRTVSFDSSFLWTFVYKNQFGIDPARILLPAIREMQEVEDDDLGFKMIELIGFSGIAEISWSMAKLADKSTLDYESWIASFVDDFPIMDMIAEIIPIAIDSCFSTKNFQAPEPPKKKATGQKKK